MSHEFFRLAEASPQQLDLAMGIVVVGVLVMGVFLYVLVKWSQPKVGPRGRQRPRATRARDDAGRRIR